MIGIRTALTVGLLGGITLIVAEDLSANVLATATRHWASQASSEWVKQVHVFKLWNVTQDELRTLEPSGSLPLEILAALEADPAQGPVRVDDPRSVPTGRDVEGVHAGFRAIRDGALHEVPSPGARSVGRVRAGEPLEVTGRSEDHRWYRVLLDDRLAFVGADVVRAEWVDTSVGRVHIEQVDRALDVLETGLRHARFRETLRAAGPLRLELEHAGRWVSLNARVVRLELCTALAELALGRPDDASLSLARALAVDPALKLDPLRHPPKLRRLLDVVRKQR